MKKTVVTLLMTFALCVLAAPALSDNENCLMCHQDLKDNPVEAHRDCMACHADGAEEHAENPRVAPEPVTNETCETCHAPTEEFMEIRAHQMDMECAACHTIHEK